MKKILCLLFIALFLIFSNACKAQFTGNEWKVRTIEDVIGKEVLIKFQWYQIENIYYFNSKGKLKPLPTNSDEYTHVNLLNKYVVVGYYDYKNKTYLQFKDDNFDYYLLTSESSDNLVTQMKNLSVLPNIFNECNEKYKYLKKEHLFKYVNMWYRLIDDLQLFAECAYKVQWTECTFDYHNNLIIQGALVSNKRNQEFSVKISMLDSNDFYSESEMSKIVSKKEQKRQQDSIAALQNSLKNKPLMGTITAATSTKNKMIRLPFDSTLNQQGPENVESYIGQILYVIDNSPLSNYFIKNYLGHYFIVKDVVPNSDKKTNSYSNHEFSKTWTFYLVDKEDSTIQETYTYETYQYHGHECYSDFPFLVVSHYNYLNKHFIGKQIITKMLYSNKDIITGDTIIIPDMSKKIWTCKEITLLKEEKWSSLVMIVKSGNTTAAIPIGYFRLDDPYQTKCIKYVYLKSEWDKLISTYGYTMVKAAFNNEIKVGMPLKLLQYSWGEPDKKNNYSYGSQYVYDYYWDDPNYVYIKGGKVTGWN